MFTRGLFVASLLLATSAVAGSSSAQEVQKETVNAFSIWSASGRMLQTQLNGLTFVGVVSGRFLIEEDSGPSEAGNIICPVTIEIDTGSGNQSAMGKCTIVTPEGSRAFSEIACAGSYAVGCEGKLTFVGGTGHLSGVSGGGKMRVHNVLSDAELHAGNIIEQASAGIAVWRDLQVSRPAQ